MVSWKCANIHADVYKSEIDRRVSFGVEPWKSSDGVLYYSETGVDFYAVSSGENGPISDICLRQRSVHVYCHLSVREVCM